jgi:ABC-2 type transport system permease protein
VPGRTPVAAPTALTPVAGRVNGLETPMHAGAAPTGRRVLAQARFDTRSMLRNGEQLLLTVILPLFVLIGLARSGVVDLGSGRRIDLATPGVLALALISTSFTGQAIATGFDRRAGLLRLLGTTPLGRTGLIAGRVIAVLTVELVQIVLLGIVGVLLGWHPAAAGVLPAVLVAALGTAAFVSFGLLLAGSLRAEAVLAAANLIWAMLLAGGGVVLSTAELGPLGSVVKWLPSGALGDGLRTALAHGHWPTQDLLVLILWTVVAATATTRYFHWD